LDWDFYCSIKSPIAKRLFRFLDKRFYLSRSFSIGLRELAVNRLGLSSNHNTAQLKRLLQRGATELEQRWTLAAKPINQRFRKVGRGQWQVHYSQKPLLNSIHHSIESKQEVAHQGKLISALTKRGVTKNIARELTRNTDLATINEMISLYDWYNSQQQPRGVGFLIDSIRNAERIVLPKEFIRQNPRLPITTAGDSRKSPQRFLKSPLEHKADENYKSRYKAFMEFWRTLSEDEKRGFEQESYEKSDHSVREGLKRAENLHPKIYDHYRIKILLDHYKNTQGRKG
jgi:hypothetical protein